MGKKTFIRARSVTVWANICASLEFPFERRDPLKSEPFFAKWLLKPKIALSSEV
jgi:hypothetical protein